MQSKLKFSKIQINDNGFRHEKLKSLELELNEMNSITLYSRDHSQ